MLSLGLSFDNHNEVAKHETDEEPLAAAIREFQEEIGLKVSEPFIELGLVK